MKAMQAGLAASVGVVLPDRSIPYWLADMIAAVSEGAWPETAPCSARRPRANSGIGHELAWGRDWPPWEIDRSGEGGRGKTQADAPWHTRRDAHIPAGVPSLAAITRRQQERAGNWRNSRGSEVRVARLTGPPLRGATWFHAGEAAAGFCYVPSRSGARSFGAASASLSGAG